MGDDVAIFDGGGGTAREMKRRLSASGLLRETEREGTVTFINSRDTKEIIDFCKHLLNQPY